MTGACRSGAEKWLAATGQPARRALRVVPRCRRAGARRTLAHAYRGSCGAHAAGPGKSSPRRNRHPLPGRAERAARHGRPLDPDDLLAENNLRRALETTGRHVDEYGDAAHHFLARAVRRG
ncbi:hypothetical protein [Streptomyces sp. NPDC001927]